MKASDPVSVGEFCGMFIERAMRTASLLLLATVLTGCAPNQLPSEALIALRTANSFELFSLDPLRPSAEAAQPQAEAFRGWTVLGSTQITDAATRSALVDALVAGVADNSDGMEAACFWPRHGIRVTRGGKQHDFVICFECYQGKWYSDGEPKKEFLLSRSPQSAFDQALRDAGVPLAAPPSR